MMGHSWLGLMCVCGGAAYLAGCGGAAAPDSSSEDVARRLSTLLISLDTTRADALGSYGNRASHTPSLDRLASESVQYDYAYTVTPLTLPAHASMLTGLYPLRHGVRANGPGSLPEEARTLAEAATESGYQTAAFVAVSVLNADLGLGQGFQLYDGPKKARGSSAADAERNAAEVVDAALLWLEQLNRDRPFFLFVHLYDPHAPYNAPESYRGRTSNPYLDELAYVDGQVQRLLAALSLNALLERTLVTLVADHGEGLGEHTESTHGWLCFDTTLRVPLLIRYPDGYRAGERSSEVVSVVDVAPTLAAAMGFKVGADIDGRNLFHAELEEERGVYFETYHGYEAFRWCPLSGWVDARGKYIHSSAPQFFENRADATEEHNLIASASLEAYRAAMERLSALPRLGAGAGVDAELMQSIADLGYVSHPEEAGSLPDPLAVTNLPAPHNLIHHDVLLRDAMQLANGKRYAEARSLLAMIRERNPRNRLAADLLGFCLVKEEQWTQAFLVLQELVDDGAEIPNAFHHLGLALEQLGRFKQAAAAFTRTLELDPTWAVSRSALVRVREREADSL